MRKKPIFGRARQEQIRRVCDALKDDQQKAQRACAANFGCDLLPRLHVSYLILGGITAAMIALSILKMRTFQFSFTGGYSDE